MKHQEGYFKGVRGANIYYQNWLPDGDPRAILLVVHGLAEHCGRYMNVVNHLVPRGYAVYGVDHLGHGKSEGVRVYVEHFDDYTDTLKVFFDLVQEWQPGKPIFLLGHSLGGLIGVIYLLDHQSELSGAIISGPLTKVPENTSPTTIMVGKLLSVLLPKFGLLLIEAEGVSKDPQVVQAYVSDPLVYRGKITARVGAELLKTMQQATEQASKIELPIIILQGSADRIVDPNGARMLYDTVSSSDKTLKIYDGFYHEIFNEPERDQVLHDVEVWLEAHLK
jgi:alpha-beta hydrolase superfamily lysophospholipase